MRNVKFIAADSLDRSPLWISATNLGLSENTLSSRLIRVARGLDHTNSNLVDLLSLEGLLAVSDSDPSGVSPLIPVVFDDSWFIAKFCKKLQGMHQEWGNLFGSSVSYAPLFDSWRALGCSGKLWDYHGEKRMNVPSEALPAFQAILLDMVSMKRLQMAILDHVAKAVI